MNAPAVEQEPVTVVVTRRVRPGREAEFEVWLEGIGQAAAKFPGFLGRRILRPKDHEHPEYVVVFKFDRYENLRRWTESEERRVFIEKSAELAVEEMREAVLTGLERWFTLDNRRDLPPPPRYKMCLLLLCVIYPVGLGLNALFGRWLVLMPVPVRSLLVMATELPLLTYVIMPRVTRLLRFWLYTS